MNTITKLIAAAAFAGVGISSATAATILSREHTDVGIAFEDGAFDLHIHSEHYGLEFAPDQAVLRVLPAAETEVPANPAYAFLGTAGESTWILPQDEATAEDLGLLYLGLGAEEADPADFDGNLTFALTNVAFTPEPGGSPTANFSVFTTSSLGVPTVLMSTHDGIDSSDATTVIPGAHAHLNWSFSAPGKYVVTFQVSGELAGGGGTVSDTADYTFVVKSHTSPTGTQLGTGEIIEIGGEAVRVSKITAPSVGVDDGSLSVVNFKPLASPTTVTSGNDSVLALLHGYELSPVAREGDAAPGIPGATLKSFGEAFVSASGESAFVAKLAGASPADDTALFGEYYDDFTMAFATALILREGGAVPGHADTVWKKVDALIPGTGGVVNVIASAKNTVSGQNSVFLVRATPDDGDFALSILAATGTALETDAGTKTVKSIQRPKKAGQRFANAAGTCEVLIQFTDKTSEVVRFSTPQVSVE